MKRWCVSVLCAATTFVLLPATLVAAHASLVDSNLVDGSVLAKSPPVAELRFSEPVLAAASTFTLLRLGSDTNQALQPTATDGGATLLAEIPKLQRGAYILRYVAVDPADLHRTVGSISFGVGVAAPPSQSGELVDSSWLSTALRAVTDGALLLGVGAVVVAVLMVRAGRQHLYDVTHLALVSVAVVAAGWIALLIADAASVGLGNVPWSSLLLRSDPGRRSLMGVQLAIVMRWGARLLRRATSQASRLSVVRILAVIAAGFVAAAAYGGHAGIGGSFIVGVVLRGVHLGSLCMWIGAVAAMWMLAMRDRRLRSLWPSISSFAVIGLAATGASGFLLSGRGVATVTALLSTNYGHRIVVKMVIIGALAVLGVMARRRVARGNEPGLIPLELAVAGVAVVIAALLVGSAPARGPQFSPVSVAAPQIVTTDNRDLTVSASIEPARPGPNLVQVRVLDTRRPSPGPVSSVTVRVIGGDGAVVAKRDGRPADGLVEWADVDVPNPGLYRVEIDISRPALPLPPVVASWQVEPTPVPRVPVMISTRSWAPLAAALAALWVVIVGAGWWGTRRLTGVVHEETGPNDLSNRVACTETPSTFQISPGIWCEQLHGRVSVATQLGRDK
jgi:methionine-rich copper-binding protein CopC/putative copper export protein